MLLHFIAITTPAEVDIRVLRFKQYMLEQYGCKVALRSPAHITLISPFSLPEVQKDLLRQTMQDFAAGVADFMVELKNFSRFAPRVIYVDVMQSELLHQTQRLLEERLLPHFPLKRSTRPFHPHVTITNRDLDQSYFGEAWDHFKEQEFRAAFFASGLSLLQYNGSRWQIISTAPFLGRQDNFVQALF